MGRAIKNENDNISAKKQWSFRSLCGSVFLLLIFASSVAVRASVMTSAVRLLLAATFLFSIFTGIVYLCCFLKHRYQATLPVLFFLIFFIFWMGFGGKPVNKADLRSAYVGRLVKLNGTPYVMGGETTGGIDCSGLARVGLWQAMVVQGIKYHNPRLLGPSLWKFWWRDMSVESIAEGRYGYTKVIGHADMLAGYDTSKLKRGDMAVASGRHVIIYRGDGKWIEANQNDGKVVINKAPKESKRGWFRRPVVLMRWRMLD